MKNIVCVCLCLTIIVLHHSCNVQNTHENLSNITEPEVNVSGTFMNTTVINSLPDSLLGKTPNYCLEMRFINKDSLFIDNGFEGYNVCYQKQKANLYAIKNASWKGDMFFEITNDSTILLIDSAWTNIKTPSVFSKTKAFLTFENYINNKVITGTYTWLTVKSSSQEKVEFTSDGKITGHKEFDAFALCYAGDCMSEPAENINTITLLGKMTDSYAFRIDHKTKIVSIYQLAPAIKDIKGDRKVEQKLYELIPNKK